MSTSPLTKDITNKHTPNKASYNISRSPFKQEEPIRTLPEESYPLPSDYHPTGNKASSKGLNGND